MSVYPKSGHDLGRDMIIFEPYVDQDAQNQSKLARVTFLFDSVPAWMAGKRKKFSKNGQKMALKWLNTAFSVIKRLPKLLSSNYYACKVTNQSTQM